MEFFTPRKLKFKAWNTETKLLMRLNNIDCVKGELVKRGNILLQFTGLHDKQEEEIYDMDLLLKDSEKFIVRWASEQNAWEIRSFPEGKDPRPFAGAFASRAIRLCNYFESVG
jgi:hypothetical protein